MSPEKETAHLVRERHFGFTTPTRTQAVQSLLRLLIGDEAFTGTVTIHIFRGTAQRAAAQERAAVDNGNLTPRRK